MSNYWEDERFFSNLSRQKSDDFSWNKLPYKMDEVSKNLIFAQAMRFVNAGKWREASELFASIGDTAMAQWAHFKLESKK